MKIFTVLLFCVLVYANSVTAQMTLQFPGTGTYSAEGCLACSGMEWYNAQAVTANDNVFATTSLYHFNSLGIYRFSRALMGSDFGFSIPANATITGIGVRIRRQSALTHALKDSTVQLMQQSLPVGDNKRKYGSWSTSLSNALYGGSNDLWGTTWSPAQINSSGFGVWMKVYNKSSNDNVVASVDFYAVIVYYTPQEGGRTEHQTLLYAPCNALSIIPNPSSQQTTIQFQAAEKGNVTVSVFNLSGQRMLSMNEECNGGMFSKALDLSALPSGEYVVRCSLNKKSWVGNMVKE